MNDPQDRMSATQFKNRYRMSSGWPNVQREVEARQEQAKEDKREAEMLKAGAQIKRGPGRPPKSESND
jgi:hypothetical protein